MIEAIVPRKSVECKVNGNYKGQTATTVTVKKNEAGNEEPPAPQPVISASLHDLRQIQYQTIEKLCKMRTVLTGEDFSGTLEIYSEPTIDTLLGLTATICQQGEIIDRFVEECRGLLGI